jgi:hypothetical protein
MPALTPQFNLKLGRDTRKSPSFLLVPFAPSACPSFASLHQRGRVLVLQIGAETVRATLSEPKKTKNDSEATRMRSSAGPGDEASNCQCARAASRRFSRDPLAGFALLRCYPSLRARFPGPGLVLVGELVFCRWMGAWAPCLGPGPRFSWLPTGILGYGVWEEIRLFHAAVFRPKMRGDDGQDAGTRSAILSCLCVSVGLGRFVKHPGRSQVGLLLFIFFAFEARGASLVLC